MPGEKTQTENLFTYGTLQTPAVQLSTFGRRLNGKSDALVGYHLKMVRIDDREFVAASGTAIHRNLEFTGNDADVVEGTMFTVTTSELEQADAYEPAGYQRTLVHLRSGISAWAYFLTRQTQEPSADPN
jgi:gamma-glutamylcyclotransferase (GGCT)/AIG2-like uncharacterized protein YtfP